MSSLTHLSRTFQAGCDRVAENVAPAIKGPPCNFGSDRTKGEKVTAVLKSANQAKNVEKSNSFSTFKPVSNRKM